MADTIRGDMLRDALEILCKSSSQTAEENVALAFAARQNYRPEVPFDAFLTCGGREMVRLLQAGASEDLRHVEFNINTIVRGLEGKNAREFLAGFLWDLVCTSRDVSMFARALNEASD